MSNLLPAKIERVWLVDQRGTAVENRPPPKALSSGQRHYMYRLGLMALDQFMKSRGFVSNMSESSTRLSYEKRRVLIDVAVKRPDNIAFITSYPGYEYNQKRINAKVVYASDIMEAEYVVQIIIGDALGSRQPIFVPLPKTLDKPARYVLQNVLGAIAAACQAIPAVRDAFSDKAVEEAQQRPVEDLVDDGTVPLLPDQ